ncbi:MAG: SDR family oxidoreductase [Anaerolineales bacterium]|jgi:3-oxoacyl-[acyl-carrier protein] reductase
MELGLTDKVALVTAASRGLGKAAALALAREGARVSISSRSKQIESTAKELQEETGSEILPIRADLSQPAEIKSLVKRTLDHFGQIDLLVINAGGPPPGNFLSLGPEDWQKAINLTLMSAVRLCYAVVPHMIERGSGSIVASQSYSVKQPIDNLILSNSIRLAVIGLMKSLANELGPKGIRVNSINPAWTLTDRVEQLMADRAERNKSSIQEEASKVYADVPLGRMGTVEEYGRAIAWLASPAASFIHGHALMFDGGATKTVL